MLKLRYCSSQSLQKRALDSLVEGLQDFAACQGRQPSLSNSLSHDYPFLAVDHSMNLSLRLAS
eukprot:181024-Pelagomonas_calceolata.AAC.1